MAHTEKAQWVKPWGRQKQEDQLPAHSQLAYQGYRVKPCLAKQRIKNTVC